MDVGEFIGPYSGRNVDHNEPKLELEWDFEVPSLRCLHNQQLQAVKPRTMSTSCWAIDSGFFYADFLQLQLIIISMIIIIAIFLSLNRLLIETPPPCYHKSSITLFEL